MRFGLIGYGLWGRQHAAVLARMPEVALTAIAAGGSASTAEARREHPTVEVVLGYQALLARADVEVVVIATPNHSHREIAVAALEAGKDVLLEAPMATNAEDCDAIAWTAARSGRVLSLGHLLRYSEQWGRIKQIVDAGAIGEPMHARVDLFRAPHRPGSGGWRYTSGRVGSWSFGEPLHFFDLLLWCFAGWGPPVAVRSWGNAKRGRGRGMLDNLTSVVRWRTGLYATVEQSLAGFGRQRTVEMVGGEGSLRSTWVGDVERAQPPHFELKLQARHESFARTVAVERSGEIDDLQAQASALLQALQERRPLVDAEAGRRAVALCLAAERSAVEDREIALEA